MVRIAEILTREALSEILIPDTPEYDRLCDLAAVTEPVLMEEDRVGNPPKKLAEVGGR